jgi:hypothetical protein
LETEKRIFRSFRSRTAGIAFFGVVVSVAALFLLYRYEPSPIPSVRAVESGKLDPGLFGALATCIETVLALSAISLIFEVFLRESYAKALRRYLRLGAALVRSGLQDIRRNPDIEWKAIIEPASTIRVLVRDPSVWLIPSLAHIIVAAEKRTVNVTIGFPDPTGEALPAIAQTVGLDASTLKGNIETAVKSIQNQWQAQRPHLKHGSQIRVVAYDGIPLNEVLVADDVTVCLVAQALRHPVGEWQVASVFEQRDGQYPSNVLRQALVDFDELNELWAGDVS